MFDFPESSLKWTETFTVYWKKENTKGNKTFTFPTLKY